MAETAAAVQVSFPEATSALLEALNQQRLEGQLCDLAIHVQGRVFRAHRAVLAACSPYFHDQVLLKGMSAVVLPSVMDPAAFELVLGSAYTGRLRMARDDLVNFLTVGSVLRGGRGAARARRPEHQRRPDAQRGGPAGGAGQLLRVLPGRGLPAAAASPPAGPAAAGPAGQPAAALPGGGGGAVVGAAVGGARGGAAVRGEQQDLPVPLREGLLPQEHARPARQHAPQPAALRLPRLQQEVQDEAPPDGTHEDPHGPQALPVPRLRQEVHVEGQLHAPQGPLREAAPPGRSGGHPLGRPRRARQEGGGVALPHPRGGRVGRGKVPPQRTGLCGQQQHVSRGTGALPVRRKGLLVLGGASFADTSLDGPCGFPLGPGFCRG